jgi:hypothetical protein
VVLTIKELNPKFVEDAEAWFVGAERRFDFDDLDERSLAKYFNLE